MSGELKFLQLPSELAPFLNTQATDEVDPDVLQATRKRALSALFERYRVRTRAHAEFVVGLSLDVERFITTRPDVTDAAIAALAVVADVGDYAARQFADLADEVMPVVYGNFPIVHTLKNLKAVVGPMLGLGQ